MSPKRWFDLTLLAAASPIATLAISLLAALVWLADGRPIFFRQVRVGRGRRPFRIWKLRTMTCEPEEHARRPTRLGGWLRHRGLDELPQLINVLAGEMSLVGPRPLTPADAGRLAADHAAFEDRFHVAPGITGLAQVCGARGAAPTAQLDAEYARTRSAAMDLGILLRTVWINVVGKRRGFWNRVRS
ncbi:MAG TPA: sugar transferase [Myxococcales bacterium]|nr:sugar transferase [Myxococcales bacterium]